MYRLIRIISRTSIPAVLFCWVSPVLLGQSLGLTSSILAESSSPKEGSIRLVGGDEAAPLCYDAQDYPGVIRALRDLADDVHRVTSMRPDLIDHLPSSASVVVVGSVEKSSVIAELVRSGKLDVSDIDGKWESFVIQTVDKPFAGVDQALVVAGSDKRGTIYGIYEMSEQIGVSPWYWWADVPPMHRAEIHVRSGRWASGEPAVRYRGIFLNNERPCLSGWTREKFGGMNASYYSKVFELLLRLRGNYLWPAMWDNAFNEDDPENPRLADEYGIVMGTSHHEPMMRAHKEWTVRRDQYGNGEWNYATNAEALKRFFREGIARNKDYENLITIGMRGDGDEGMVSSGSLEADMALIEGIFDDQRHIIAEEMNTSPEAVPQMWALFTEVQKYYDLGLRPPDDVTLLWTDDNTGNLRRLPTPEEQKRSGGSGIYYHFDMHGGPYAYQWVNTVQFPKTAEQMSLAWEYGADRIWIVNVGDLKPLELPIEFFLRMAWDPSRFDKDRITEYLVRWAERDIGSKYASEVAEIVSLYTKYNGWRKPELIKPDTFSPIHYREADHVLSSWKTLVERAEKVGQNLLSEQKAAYYQLVLHPVKGSALVAEINIVAGRNHLYAKQGRVSTNRMAARVRELFAEDQAMTDYYNRELSGGKWNHLMDQPHIGQFYWKPPVVNVMPPVSEVIPANNSSWGVSIEGSEYTWPHHYGDAVLPELDSLNPRQSYVDVYAIGLQPSDFTVESESPWIELSKDTSEGIDHRYFVNVRWKDAPPGKSMGSLLVTSGNTVVRIKVPVAKATPEQEAEADGCFATLSGPISIAAVDAPVNRSVDGVAWETIPDYGRGKGAYGVYPVTADSVIPPQEAPGLEYPVYLPRAGDYEVTLVLGPVMDFVPDRGMRIAVSFDGAPARILDIFENKEKETFLGSGWWSQFTKDNVRYLRSRHMLSSPGAHTLKVAMVDPGVLVEQIIIHDKPLSPTYFGPPPQSLFRKSGD